MSQELSILLSLKTAQALHNLNGFLEHAAEGLKELALEAAAAYLGIEGLHKLEEAAKEAIDLQEAIGRLNQKTGLSVGLLEGMKEAANKVKVPFDALSTTLGIFAQRIFVAASAGGQPADAFQRMGVSLTTADGRLRQTDVILGEVMERFKEMPDGPQKAAIAMDLFGRSGRDLIPVLNQGADGIKEFRDAGSPVTDESVAQATEFNQKLREFHEALEKVMILAVNQMLPALIKMIDRLNELATSSDNVKLAVAGLIDFFKGLVTVAVVVGAVFVSIGKVIGFAVAGWVEVFEAAWSIIKTIVANIKSIYQDIVNLVADLVDTLIAANNAMALAATGHFDEARKVMKQQIEGIKDDFSSLKDHTGIVFEGMFKEFFKMVTNIGAIDGQLMADLVGQWEGVGKFVSNLWTPSKVDVKPAAKHDTATGDAVLGNQVKALNQYNAIAADTFKVQRKIIESNPFLTQVQKAEELIPLMEKQKDLLDAELAKASSAMSNAKTDDEKIAAAKEVVKITQQQVELNAELQRQQSLGSFRSQFAEAGVELANQWGTWAQQTANAFKTTFNGAIQSISSGISGLIMGTKTWGQTLRDIGTSILTTVINAIVQMGVRWVLTQIMMAVAGKAIAAAATAANIPIAAAQSAIWAVPATLATIASYGSAAAAAPGFISLAEGITLASVAGREFGGPVSAGTPYVVGEKRRELFVPQQSGFIMPYVPGDPGSPTSRVPAQATTEVHVHTWPDEMSMNKFLRDNPGANHVMVDKMSRNSRTYRPK